MQTEPAVTESHAIVVIIGAPGAGKTRTGRRLAKLLRVPFIDTDRRIVQHHGPIADIFTHHGESHFRSIEREVVAESLAESAVVTLGGGAVLDPRTQADLIGHRVVQLVVTEESVQHRIAGGKRPLLAGGIRAWSDLMVARRPIYNRLAQLSIDTADQPVDRVAHQIAVWVEEQGILEEKE